MLLNLKSLFVCTKNVYNHIFIWKMRFANRKKIFRAICRKSKLCKKKKYLRNNMHFGLSEACQKKHFFPMQKKCTSFNWNTFNICNYPQNFYFKKLASVSVLFLGRFHQRVYAKLLHRQIPKAQKASWLDCLFCPIGIFVCKAARKMLLKLTPLLSSSFALV